MLHEHTPYLLQYFMDCPNCDYVDLAVDTNFASVLAKTNDVEKAYKVYIFSDNQEANSNLFAEFSFDFSSKMVLKNMFDVMINDDGYKIIHTDTRSRLFLFGSDELRVV